MSELIYNGFDFSTLFVYGDPEISIVNIQPELEDVRNRNGSLFMGMTCGVSTVSVKLAALGDAATRRAAFSTLASYLMVDEPKELYLPDTPDRYYMAVANGALDMTRCIGGEITTLTFTLTDPVAYGETKSVSMSANSTVTFTVGGTAPTYINVLCTSATPDGSGRWAVQDQRSFSNGNTGPLIAVFDDTSTHRVEFLSEQRICVVDSSEALMDISGDWIIAPPGTHALYHKYGSGAATVSWIERWY